MKPKEDSPAKQPPAKAHSSVEESSASIVFPFAVGLHINRYEQLEPFFKEERPPARPASPPVKQPATKAPPPFLVAARLI